MSTPIVHPSGRPNLVIFNVVGISLTGDIDECIQNYNTALGQFLSTIAPQFREYVSHTTWSDDLGGGYSRTSQFMITSKDGDYDANGDLQIQNDFVVGAP